MLPPSHFPTGARSRFSVSHALMLRRLRYSPLLCFDVADMDVAIQRALGMGAHLDGPIKYPAHGAVASIRSPDGHMIGLFQPADREGL